MQLLRALARAYVYSGNWVADCPRECGNVEFLCDPVTAGGQRTVQRTRFVCTYCMHTAGIEWPADVAAIMAILELRPVPHTRNWYPARHDTAMRFRVPDGQSVAQLREENAEHGIVPDRTLSGVI